MTPISTLKPVRWVGSSKKDFMTFPAEVQDEMGHALYRAQLGSMHVSAKALKGFGGGGVIELVEDHQSGTYRAVYTVRFANAVYVLHAFQKKSRSGIRTDKADIELVRKRLQIAAADVQRSLREA